MNKKVLLIIAAGDSSRMGYLPKAISLINGKPNLLHTIENAYEFYDQIIIASNHTNFDLYKEVIHNYIDLDDKIHLIPIKSGRGCGHAILETLGFIDTNVYDNISICWGDTYFSNKELFENISNIKTTTSLTIPVIYEKNPYVWFKFSDNKAEQAMFSKRGDKISDGYHDQSIFVINNNFYNHLLTAHNVLDKNGKYINKELIFLDIVHYLWNINEPAHLLILDDKFLTKSFNTESELNEINNYFNNIK